MPTWLKRASKYLWLPAVLVGVGGVVGIACLTDPQKPLLTGVLVLIAPHLGGVVLTSCACRRHPISAVVALAGQLTMTGLTWWHKLTPPQTEGFEYEFNNALDAVCWCGGDYIVLAIATLVAAIVSRFDELPGNFGSVHPSPPLQDAGKSHSPADARRWIP